MTLTDLKCSSRSKREQYSVTRVLAPRHTRAGGIQV
jgi:hypothetical protein